MKNRYYSALIVTTALTFAFFVPWGISGENQFLEGDFESGGIQPGVGQFNVFELFEGSPITGEKLESGDFCGVANFPEKQTISIGEKHFVDPTAKCRISLKFYTESAVKVQVGGYAFSTSNDLLKNEDGKVWGYSLRTLDRNYFAEGPLDGWTVMEATIGPEGSSADYIWKPETLWISMTVRIKGGTEEGDLYVDDISIEAIEE